MSSSTSPSSKENFPSLLRDVINDQKNTQRSLPGRLKATESLSGRVAAMVLKMEKKHSVKAPMAQQESLEDEEKKRTKRKYMGSISGSKLLQNLFTPSKKEKTGEPKPKMAGGRVVAVSGAAGGEPMVFKEGGCLDPVLRRSKTSADANSLGPVPVLIGGRLKKRQSESSIGTDGRKCKRLSTALPPPPKLLPPCHSAAIVTIEPAKPALRSSSPIKDRSPVRRRAPPSERPLPVFRKPPAPVGRRVSPSPAELKTSVVESSRIPQISITPAQDKPKESISLDNFEHHWRQERRPAPPRGLSRTMTYVESKILPPLYETGINEDVVSCAATVGPGKERKRLRRYGGSNTTSTYQGKKDTAPDASPRRHLIGFLHRTSHLSLTSELSGDASFYLIGHRGRRFEDSTLGSESDARVFSDEDDRGSTTTDITSVSRQHVNAYRRRQKRKNYRKPSRASSFSSITESSMSLDVITVTLNMDPVNFLGISIVGESSTRGDNGIYVANIIKGGAVALDGRIEAGDMILQVNEISFENFTNDQAVDVLREAVARKGPIKLTVAKSFNQGPKSCFTMPRNHRDEPVRPIDTQAWIAHTNAMLNRGMPSILEGSEGAPTPVPGDWPHGRPPSSSTVTSGGSNGQTAVPTKLNVNSDKKKIIQAMVMPDSGLEIKDRHWLKLLVPNSMIGTELLDWLLENVDGLRDKKEAKKFATDLLKLKLITQMHANQQTFIEQRYYMVGPECQDFLRYRTHPEEFQQPSCSNRWQQRWSGGMPKSQAPASMVSGYASMPVSPFPHMIPRPGGPDVRSQTSGGSGEGSGSGSDHKRRQVLLPPAPPSSANLPARLDEFPMEMAASRQSFRQAMSHPLHSEFFIDHL